MEKRVSPSNIKSLNVGEVFVFGSNQSGKHTRFAAKFAMKLGAIFGQAEGLQGRTYGIPTKNGSLSRILTIKEIKPYVDRFIECAKANPHLTFLVTELGCGASGYKPKDIAPLFKDAISLENVHLPHRFWHKLKNL